MPGRDDVAVVLEHLEREARQVHLLGVLGLEEVGRIDCGRGRSGRGQGRGGGGGCGGGGQQVSSSSGRRRGEQRNRRKLAAFGRGLFGKELYAIHEKLGRDWIGGGGGVTSCD